MQCKHNMLKALRVTTWGVSRCFTSSWGYFSERLVEISNFIAAGGCTVVQLLTNTRIAKHHQAFYTRTTTSLRNNPRPTKEHKTQLSPFFVSLQIFHVPPGTAVETHATSVTLSGFVNRRAFGCKGDLQQAPAHSVSLTAHTYTITTTSMIIISRPMDVRHVDGIVVKGVTRLQPAESFERHSLRSDEPLSHGSLANGQTELPPRMNNIVNALRKPGLSKGIRPLKLRGASFSSMKNDCSNLNMSQSQINGIFNSSNKNEVQPLKMRSSMSRLRKKIGLDRDLWEQNTVSREAPSQIGIMPEPLEQNISHSQIGRPDTRPNIPSSIYSASEMVKNINPHSENLSDSPPLPRSRPSLIRKKEVPTNHPTYTTQHDGLPPGPPSRSISQEPSRDEVHSRVKRADSGTAINFHDTPIDERPLGFQQIMAMRNFQDRMAQYKKTREFWAHADHGLIDWTGLAIAPKADIKRM